MAHTGDRMTIQGLSHELMGRPSGNLDAQMEDNELRRTLALDACGPQRNNLSSELDRRA